MGVQERSRHVSACCSRDRDLNYLGEVFDIGCIPSRVLSPLHILSTVYNSIVVATQRHCCLQRPSQQQPNTITSQSFLLRSSRRLNAQAGKLQVSPFICTSLSSGSSSGSVSCIFYNILYFIFFICKSHLSFHTTLLTGTTC